MGDFLLSVIPSNVITFFVVCILSYMIYWVYSYRKLLLVVGLVAALGCVIYLWYGKQELTKQVTSSQVFDNFNRKTLGYSLNNPGNIRSMGAVLPGEVSSSNNAFKEFTNMKYGFRAMTGLLHSYIRNGHNTIRSIIATSTNLNSRHKLSVAFCQYYVIGSCFKN